MSVNHTRVGEVGIEEETERTGWAVYTGCEGDDPTFVAFFVNREMAELYVKACTADSDADWWLCDPDIAPAILGRCCILAANHFDNVKGVDALRKVGGLSDYESLRWREIAAASMNR